MVKQSFLNLLRTTSTPQCAVDTHQGAARCVIGLAMDEAEIKPDDRSDGWNEALRAVDLPYLFTITDEMLNWFREHWPQAEFAAQPDRPYECMKNLQQAGNAAEFWRLNDLGYTFSQIADFVERFDLRA